MKLKLNIQSELNKDLTFDQLRKVLFKSMIKMQELATINAPVDTGRLRNSINLNPATPGFDSYVLSEGTDYGPDVEFGTSPRIVNPAELKDWSRRVLKDENASFAVAAKIAKFGTPAQPFFRPALSQVKMVWMPRYFQQVLSKNGNNV